LLQELSKKFTTKFRPTAKRFIEYYEAEYAPRVDQWAFCKRRFYHASTETNMPAESFFNVLKVLGSRVDLLSPCWCVLCSLGT
jgi:hypothetical protein